MTSRREAEVEQDKLAGPRSIDVVRLQIAMDDRRIAAVQIRERTSERYRTAYEFVFRDRFAPVERVREVLAFNVLHDEELSGGLRKVVDDDRQRRMPQRGEQARFAFERPVRLRRFGDHPLCGNRIVQPQVDGFVHWTHAAFAERPHDSVTLIQKRPCHDVEPTRILVNRVGTWLANVRHRYLSPPRALTATRPFA